MMKKVSTVGVSPGNVLAESIYDAESRLLLREGIELTETTIALLRKRGCWYVHIALDNAKSGSCRTCEAKTETQQLGKSDTPLKAWVCGDCRQVYFSSEPNLVSDVAAVDMVHGSEPELSIPSAVERAFRTSWKLNEAGSENRKHKRHVITLPAMVVPLNEYFKIAGDPISMTTQNISQAGVCLIHVTSIDCPYIYVDFALPTEERVRTLAKILRQKERSGAYEIGCMYISRIIGKFAEKT